jgi:hypothetical protein
MNKVFLFLSLLSISSCARIDKLTLTTNRVNYKKCKYHLTGRMNNLTLKGDFDIHKGDQFKLFPTNQDSELIFTLNSYSPYESDMSDYYVKRGNSVIIFRDSSNKWNFDSKFKLVKND